MNIFLLREIVKFFAGCIGAWFHFFFDQTRILGFKFTFDYCKVRKFYLFNWIISGGIIALAFNAPTWKQAFLVGFGIRAIYEQFLGDPKDKNVERLINDILEKTLKESKKLEINDEKELEKFIKKEKEKCEDK